MAMSPSGLSLVAHFEAGQADHGAGQIVDAHRLAHVEHEHFAALRHGAGLDDELGRLGDRHEIADDLGMGDGTGPPARICWRNSCTTEPELSSTLPKRTMVKMVRSAVAPRAACRTSSARRLLAPMMLVGRTALSVEISTKQLDPGGLGAFGEHGRAERVVAQPADGFCSTIGTCL